MPGEKKRRVVLRDWNSLVLELVGLLLVFNESHLLEYQRTGLCKETK